MNRDAMNPDNGSDDLSLPLPDLERIDRICFDFESACKAGARPRIEDFLERTVGSERTQLLRELLFLDLDYRMRQDERPGADEYQARFPEDREVIARAFHQASTRAEPPGRTPGTGPPAAEEPALPSQFGNYELLDVLGEGGMGVVYRARQRTPDRIVAVKIIRSDRLAASDAPQREKAVERFRAEAQAAAGLEHDHIVPVYDVGELDGRPYFSMRYIAGEGLDEVLRDGPLPGRDAAALLEPVARAVQYAHDHDVIHRDVKPRNVLLDRQRHPFVADFGLAKSFATAQDLTGTQDVLGTPAYMSPEQAQRPAEVDRRTDVYSIGATLYELLTARPPFRAATPAETQRQVIDNEPVPPRQLNPAVDRDLETICLKCLEKEREKRYATAEELADEFARYQEGRPIRARPITRPARLWRWCKRNRAVASLGTAAALLLLVLAIGGPAVAVREAGEAEYVRGLLKENEALLGRAKDGEGAARREAGNARIERDNAREAEEDARAAEKDAREAAAAERRQKYVADMKRAEYYWELANTGVVRALLEQYLPKPGEEDLRSFEWYYWWQQCHRDLMKLEHESEVQYVAFSPDGKLLATASMGSRVTPGYVTLWDVSTGEKIHTYRSRYREFRGLAFSPEGDTLAAAGAFIPMIKKWDVEQALSGNLPEPQPPSKLLESSPIYLWALAFAPDLQGYVYAVGSAVTWRDFAGTKPERYEGEFEGIKILGGPGKRSMVVLKPDRSGRFYSVTDEDAPPPREYGGPVFCMAFSPDGRTVAAGGRQGAVKLWDATTHKLKMEEPLKGHTGIVWAVAFSPDGESLASAGTDGTIVLWEVATGTRIERLESHTREVRSLAFLSEGSTLASTGADGTIKLWDLATGQLKSTLKGHEGPINCLACSADGRMLATAGTDRTVRLWSTTEEGDRLGRDNRPPAAPAWGREKAPPASSPSPVYCVAFSSDGNTLAVTTRNSPKTPRGVPADVTNSYGSTNRVELWDWRKRKRIRSGGSYLSTLSIKPSAALSPDGRLLYTGWFLQDLTSRKRLIRTGWSLGGEEVSVSPPVAFLVKSRGEQSTSGNVPQSLNPEVFGAFSPDGQLLATAGLDGTVKLWEPTTGKPVDKLDSGASCCLSVAFSADGKTLAVAADRYVQLWNVDGRKLQHTFRGHSDYVRSVVFSRDGKTAVSASSDGTVKLWDTNARSARATLGGHYGGVSSVAISPDDRTVASAGRDGTIKLWDLQSGEEKTTLRGHRGWVTSVAFSPDGLTLASTGEDGTVRLWNGASAAEATRLPGTTPPATTKEDRID